MEIIFDHSGNGIKFLAKPEAKFNLSQAGNEDNFSSDRKWY